MPYLIQKLNDQEITRWDVTNITSLIFGRSTETDVFIEDPSVSRNHCELRRNDTRFFITDLDSVNGTFINGKQIIEARLKNGDEIIIGKYLFQFINDESISDSESKRMLLKDTSIQKIDIPVQWYITITTTRKNIEQTTLLKNSEYLIGKSSVVDIPLSGWGIRSVHAVIIRDKNKLLLIKTTPKNNITINAHSIGRKTDLHDNDIIEIEKYQLKVYIKND